MTNILEDIKTILKLKGYDYKELSSMQCISTYLTIVLGYSQEYSKINLLDKIFFNFTKASKPNIILSIKIEDDLMTINTENAEWYINEIKYTTDDMLKKIHSNEL